MPRCPACGVHCQLIDYEGVKVHNCGDCGGYWLSPGKLSRIASKREIQMPEPVRQKMMDMADDQHRPEELMCLSCGVVMEKEQFRIWDDIILDHCPKCKRIWLDQGELEKCQIYSEYLEDNPQEVKTGIDVLIEELWEKTPPEKAEQLRRVLHILLDRS